MPVAHPDFPCHSTLMTQPNPMAGGVFLCLAIIAGLAWGATTGQAMLGVIAGTIGGLILMAAFWLVERRKRR